MGIKFKKYLAITLILLVMLHSSIFPVVVFADDLTPVDTSTPTQTTVDNSGTVNNSINTTANTGDNSINQTPTDTPTPTDTVTPTSDITLTDTPTDTPTPTPASTSDLSLTSDVTPDSSASNSPDFNLTPTPIDQNSNISLSNSADVSNNTNSNANSGENLVATYSSQMTDPNNACSVGDTPSANINTGDAVSVTSVQNNVNSTSVNSAVTYQTINIFVDKNGDINLSDPFTIASNIIKEHPEDPVINVSVTNVNNYAYLSNNISSLANTGGNTINISGAGGEAIINTGNAYSIVSLLNKVNFVIANSTVHVISINVFGNLNGNIILPNFSSSIDCPTCGASSNVSNTATVENNINSIANSGTNIINGSGSITTGDATSAVNNFNLVNTNLFGTSAQVLYINNLGNWNGNFIGWDGFSAESGGASLVFYNTLALDSSNGCNCSTNVSNSAVVINNINSIANTGGNSISNGNGQITTGNAYSAVSLINFINTNFINSVGFFGFINIFGNWTGDIGGQKEFNALNVSQNNDNQNSQIISSAISSTKEQGGKLEVTSSNNVGVFVYPGDTVTFFVKVKNPGSGKVYGAKLDLNLIKNGKTIGGTTFDLGDIDAGKSVKVTTGFVLSKKAPGGLYTAKADAYGAVGPDDSTITSFSENTFNVQTVFSPVVSAASSSIVVSAAVLGTDYPSLKKFGASNSRDNGFYTLLAVLLTYFVLRGIRQRKQLGEIFAKSVTFKEKLVALKMFLF